MAKKGAKQLKSAQQRRLMFAKELKLRYEDVEYNKEREMPGLLGQFMLCNDKEMKLTSRYRANRPRNVAQ